MNKTMFIELQRMVYSVLQLKVKILFQLHHIASIYPTFQISKH